MKEQIIIALGSLPTELVTLILAILPISELRGAIPYGVYNNLPFFKVFAISIIGNLIPVIPLYFFLNHLLLFLSRFRYGKLFSDWLKRSTLKRSKVIELYEMLGLIVFVGLPLPMTGAWTGTIASVLLKLKPRYYFVGVICGVLLAGLIVSLVVLVFHRT